MCRKRNYQDIRLKVRKVRGNAVSICCRVMLKLMRKMNHTSTTKVFLQKFPDEEAARKYLEHRRWRWQVSCPNCETKDQIKQHKIDGQYRCHLCKSDFTVRSNSIMSRSHVSLHQWLHATFLAREQITSVQLSKVIGVTQKTAWLMLERLRNAPDKDFITGIFKTKKNKTASQPKSKARGWALVCGVITRNASLEGVSNRHLEEIFDIGDGSGRAWRRYLRGDRIADSIVRSAIEEIAIARGWLKLGERQWLDTSVLPDVPIHSLHQEHLSHIPTPVPPDHELNPYSAVMAAAALLSDAFRPDEKLERFREIAMGRGSSSYGGAAQREETKRFLLEHRISDGEEWRAAVLHVKRLITEGADKEVIRAQLISAYKHKGFK